MQLKAITRVYSDQDFLAQESQLIAENGGSEEIGEESILDSSESESDNQVTSQSRVPFVQNDPVIDALKDSLVSLSLTPGPSIRTLAAVSHERSMVLPVPATESVEAVQ